MVVERAGSVGRARRAGRRTRRRFADPADLQQRWPPRATTTHPSRYTRPTMAPSSARSASETFELDGTLKISASIDAGGALIFDVVQVHGAQQHEAGMRRSDHPLQLLQHLFERHQKLCTAEVHAASAAAEGDWPHRRPSVHRRGHRRLEQGYEQLRAGEISAAATAARSPFNHGRAVPSREALRHIGTSKAAFQKRLLAAARGAAELQLVCVRGGRVRAEGDAALFKACRTSTSRRYSSRRTPRPPRGKQNALAMEVSDAAVTRVRNLVNHLYQQLGLSCRRDY